MKKFLSVILSVVMLLSCMAIFVVSSSAATVTYPNGTHHELYDQNLNMVAEHYITDSFYLNQNCFIVSGYLKLYTDFYTLDDFFAFNCDTSWRVVYTDFIPEKETRYAFPNNGRTRFEYINEQVDTLNNRTVSYITIIHEVTSDDSIFTTSTLSSKYVNN